MSGSFHTEDSVGHRYRATSKMQCNSAVGSASLPNTFWPIQNAVEGQGYGYPALSRMQRNSTISSASLQHTFVPVEDTAEGQVLYNSSFNYGLQAPATTRPSLSSNVPQFGDGLLVFDAFDTILGRDGAMRSGPMILQPEVLSPFVGPFLDRRIALNQTELDIELSGISFQKAIGQPNNMSKLPNAIPIGVLVCPVETKNCLANSS
jgi:hypothetical protein